MDFVEHLKASVDIVKVVGDYVRLKRAGSGPRYVGLCPFHTEKTPSFSVHQTHQFYKCFGCGAGGDVIKFIMEIERLSFPEALKLLAERNGIPLPKRADYSDSETQLRAALYQMHEIAVQVYRQALVSPGGAEAREYLMHRGVDTELASAFMLGYSARSGQDLVQRFHREGFSEDQMEASGLVVRRQDKTGFFDRFRHRLMFPIHNESGKVIAFAGRALSDQDEPKYLNSPETPIYRKSHVLYNLHRAKDLIRRSDRCVLVEGYMDVIGLYAGGVLEVVAPCGTALTPAQIQALRRHSNHVVINFDPDPAGASAAERSIQILLAEGMHVRVLELEQGLDPDEYVKKAGVRAYRERLEAAPGYFYWLADRARQKYDIRTPEGRAGALQFLLPAIQRTPDRLERAALASDLASYLGVEAGMVLDHFRRAAVERREQPTPLAQAPIRAVEKILLSALLSNRKVATEVIPRLKLLPQLEQFATRGIFKALFAMLEAGGAWHFSEIEARLQDSDKELLASVIFSDEASEQNCSREQVLACLAKLEDERLEQFKAELRARIRQAERAGKMEEALKWVEEMNRLE